MPGSGSGAGMGRLVALALASAVLWGLWWVPVRLMEAEGLTGIWSAVAMNAAALPVLAALALRSGGFAGLRGRALWGALLAGAGTTLYSNALNEADVVRVVVLFYLAPAWSTLIECTFLGRRWSLASLAALALAFCGMGLILGTDFGPGAFGRGEAMALVAGLTWSAGTAMVFAAQDRRAGGAALAFATVGGAVLVGIAIALAERAPVPATAGVAAGLVALAAGALFVAPLMAMTLRVALRLPPATLSFLLTAEIVSGVTSSAIFLDEPFGRAEAAGAVLVALAALVEVRAQRAAALRAG